MMDGTGAVQRTVFLAVILLAYVRAQDSSGYAYAPEPEYDICNPKTPVLNPPIVVLGRPGETTEVYIYTTGVRRQCLMWFKTCEECLIKVEPVGSWSQNRTCYKAPDDYAFDCMSSCTYLHVLDTKFQAQTSEWFFSSSDVQEYQSVSSQLHVVACDGFRYATNYTMRLRLTSALKGQDINGGSNGPVVKFSSPFFPYPYPIGEVFTYKIQSFYPTDVISVMFDDWWILSPSQFTFEGSDIVTPVTGDSDRPFVTSNGPTMTITFTTGESLPARSNQFKWGFRATVRFHEYNDKILTYQTNCDRLLYGTVGGVINLGSAADGELIDCKWIINRTVDEADGVYLKIKSYAPEFNSDYSLEILKGIVSTGEPLFTSKPYSTLSSDGTILQSYEGFYIRVKGTYTSAGSLVIVYAQFLRECHGMLNYFQCQNVDRCIHEDLKCDSYDHCGDGSDEFSSTCGGGSSGGSSRYDTSISIGVIIPMVVSVFLVIIICLLIIFIRRCRRLNHSALPPGRDPRILQGRGGRRRRRNRNIQLSMTVSSGEHPPSYQEVIESSPAVYCNMAFSLSQNEFLLPQPPSYEEATSPTASGAPDSIITNINANNSYSAQNITNLANGQPGPVVPSCLSSSLDPRADVSSSSSSEGVSERDRPTEYSSTDSSSDNEHSFAHNETGPNVRRITQTSDGNLNNRGQTGSSDQLYKESDAKDSAPQEAAQVILGPPSSVKFKNGQSPTVFQGKESERGEGSRYGDNIRDQMSDTRKGPVQNENRDEREIRSDHRSGTRREDNDRERRDRYNAARGRGNRGNHAKDLSDQDRRTRGNSDQSVPAGTSNPRVQNTESGSNNRNRPNHAGSHSHDRERIMGDITAGSASSRESYPDKRTERDRSLGRERCETYPESRGRGRDSLERRNPMNSQTSMNGRSLDTEVTHVPPKVMDRSKSHSCANILDGGSSGRIEGAAGSFSQLEDKRFSYAGAGDTSVRESVHPFVNGRGLVRDRPLENLDRYAAQSCDDLRDGYRAKKHAGRSYESQDPRERTTFSGQGSANRRGNVDHTRSPTRVRDRHSPSHLALSPVMESYHDEIPDKRQVRADHVNRDRSVNDPARAVRTGQGHTMDKVPNRSERPKSSGPMSSTQNPDRQRQGERQDEAPSRMSQSTVSSRPGEFSEAGLNQRSRNTPSENVRVAPKSVMDKSQSVPSSQEASGRSDVRGAPAHSNNQHLSDRGQSEHKKAYPDRRAVPDKNQSHHNPSDVIWIGASPSVTLPPSSQESAASRPGAGTSQRPVPAPRKTVGRRSEGSAMPQQGGVHTETTGANLDRKQQSQPNLPQGRREQRESTGSSSPSRASSQQKPVGQRPDLSRGQRVSDVDTDRMPGAHGSVSCDVTSEQSRTRTSQAPIQLHFDTTQDDVYV